MLMEWNLNYREEEDDLETYGELGGRTWGRVEGFEQSVLAETCDCSTFPEGMAGEMSDVSKL